jgi:hypothetical protein
MNIVVENIGAGITHKQIKAFYRKQVSVMNTMLIILGTIMPNQFTTARWIKYQLLECGMDVSRERVSANITHIKKKQGYIKSLQYDCFSPYLIDLRVKKKTGKGNDNPITMIALGREGRGRLKRLIDENADCFRD